MKNLIAILALSSLTFGCAMKQKIMDVSMVSATHTHVPEGSRLVEKGPVTGKFCADSFKDKGSVGLFDEAIKSAQQQSGVDFISTVSFFREGNCVSIEGTGQKLADAGASVPSAPEAPTRTVTPTKKGK